MEVFGFNELAYLEEENEKLKKMLGEKNNFIKKIKPILDKVCYKDLLNIDELIFQMKRKGIYTDEFDKFLDNLCKFDSQDIDDIQMSIMDLDIEDLKLEI